MNLKITAVIPTKNRPDDLLNAVESVFNQTRVPDEFLIIDQSPSNESRDKIIALADRYPKVNLNYRHDINIHGLVHAKKVAVELAKGEIVCFLEDDVTLEVDYLEQIEKGFMDNPHMVGCSGIITNPLQNSSFYNLIFNIFHRGIFLDKRNMIYGNYSGKGHKLIPSDKISGGLSAWKKDVFQQVFFDPSNKFFMLEDVDFSTRVVKKFGKKLFINPNARLEHHWSPVNRDLVSIRQQKKTIEILTYYRQRSSWPWARLSLAWLLLGLLLESVFKSIVSKSIKPLSCYLMGLKLGFFNKI